MASGVYDQVLTSVSITGGSTDLTVVLGWNVVIKWVFIPSGEGIILTRR